jgi:hypothetical protein
MTTLEQIITIKVGTLIALWLVFGLDCILERRR